MPKAATIPLSARMAEHIIADPRWQNLTSCIEQTWQVIGSDSEALADECGEKMTNLTRLEGCLDADRMTTNCGAKGEEADTFVTELCDKYGYDAVSKLISRRVKL